MNAVSVCTIPQRGLDIVTGLLLLHIEPYGRRDAMAAVVRMHAAGTIVER